jgi:hypothetical protein
VGVVSELDAAVASIDCLAGVVARPDAVPDADVVVIRPSATARAAGSPDLGEPNRAPAR